MALIEGLIWIWKTIESNILAIIDKIVVDAVSLISLGVGLIALLAALVQNVRESQPEYAKREKTIDRLRTDMAHLRVIAVLMTVASVFGIIALLFSSVESGIVAFISFMIGLFYLLYVLLTLSSKIFKS